MNRTLDERGDGGPRSINDDGDDAGDAPLRDLIRYYELQLAACQSRPDLHRNQIAAYQRYLQRARGAGDIASYYRDMLRAGDGDLLARAEWIDRYANAARLYAAMGDDAKLRAAERNRRAAINAPPGGFVAAVIAAKRVTEPRRIAADTANGAIAAVVTALIMWASEGAPAVREEYARTALGAWRQLRAADPACSVDRVRSHPPYRRRIPFSDDALAVIEGWLREVVGDEAEPRERDDSAAAGAEAGESDAAEARGEAIEAGGEAIDAGAEAIGAGGEAIDAGAEAIAVPSAADVAAGYHAAFDALVASHAGPALDPAVRDAYSRVFAIEAQSADAPAFLRRMAEADLLAELARAPRLAGARAEQTRTASASAQPHIARHHRELAAALPRCRTATAVEHEVERLEEAFAVESAWWGVLVRCATRPIAAALATQADLSPHRRATAQSSLEVACTILGRDADGLLQTPWVRAFVRDLHALAHQPAPGGTPHPDAPDDDGDGDTAEPSRPHDPSSGAGPGEAGLSIVPLAREAVILHVLQQAERDGVTDPDAINARVANLPREPIFATADDLAAHIAALLARAVPPDARPSPPPDARPLRLWDRAIALDRAADELAGGPRPALDSARAD